MIDLARLDAIPTLYAGAHRPDGRMCVMEAVAYIAGEPWSDHPVCVSPVIAAFLRHWNDDLPDDATRTRILKPLIPTVIGTRTTEADEIRRAWMATDWLVRHLAPIFLRLTPSLTIHAAALADLSEIVDAVSARSAQRTLDAAGAAAAAAAAAWAAAWAAGDAAGAAGDAARAAAAAAAAAWAAAWAAGDAAGAAGAAAGDAARAAAAAAAAAWAAAWAAGDAAGAALKESIAIAQGSAAALVLRMCAVGRRAEGQ